MLQVLLYQSETLLYPQSRRFMHCTIRESTGVKTFVVYGTQLDDTVYNTELRDFNYLDCTSARAFREAGLIDKTRYKVPPKI